MSKNCNYCPICEEPVEDSPPNIAVHARCWLELIEKRRRLACHLKASTAQSVEQNVPSHT